GTAGYGLRKIKLARQPFLHFLQGISVGRICATDGVYLSFHGDARFNGKLDEAADCLLPVSELPPNISQMFRAKNGALYVVGDDFLHNYLLVIKDGKVEKRQIDGLLSHAFTSIVEDLSGNIFATGGRGGLMRREAATGKIGFANLSKPFGKNVSIFALDLDARQNLWLGTSHGLARVQLTDLKFGESPIEIASDKFQTYRNDPANPGSLRYNVVTSFCPDPLQPERYLWVSTKGGGLNLFDKSNGEFQHFTSQNSDLPNDVVYGILPDFTPLAGGQGGGNIWGSTNRGLFRLTISNGAGKDAARSYRFRNFKASDGLQDDEFNTAAFARTPDGRLFFGGVNGLTAFYPSEIEDRQTDAPVRLTDLKINNLPVTPLPPSRGVSSPLDCPLHRTESISLDYTQNLVTLEFALLDFQNPQENRFRYRLEGVDPDWVEAGASHVANYAHLRPGHYLFEVQGSVSGGSWSAPASLRITVLPPWWATWWAYAAYVLALAAMAWWLIRFRQRRQALEHQLELEHLEAARLKEIDDFKSRFFTNITHEFRTPLTVILGMAEKLESDGVTSSQPVTNAVSLIKRSGQNLLRLINQILDLAKLESNSLKINYVQGDVLPYLRYVCESLHSFANSKNVMVRVESTEAKIVMDYDPERLLQIVHNLVSNAVKFTPNGGRVTVRLNSSSAGFAELEFSDTGAGIPAEDLPKIFDRFYQAENQEHAKAGGTGIGLSLTKELVKAMGGEISVESKVGKGTTFTVRLPVTNVAAASDGVT
ncbi:MAG: ATP-binding protein, partial [Bacteroidota bacterium]